MTPALQSYPDSFIDQIVRDFGYSIFPLPKGASSDDVRLDLVLNPVAQGGASTGSPFGRYGVSLSPDAPYDSIEGDVGFYWFIFSLHESINVWTGSLALNWPWADGSELFKGTSPFPSFCDFAITGELGLTQTSSIQKQMMANDANVQAFYQVQNTYGWEPFRTLFQLTVSNGITNWHDYSEPLRTSIIILFLSSGARANLLSTFEAAGLGVTGASFLEAQLLFPNVTF